MNPASAKTSINQIPALHRFTASLGLSAFDFGAGVKGKIDEFYANLGIKYLPFDPFNREQKDNTKSFDYLFKEGVDIITCANVLNVIEDQALTSTVYKLLDAAMQSHKGICFVSVYYKKSLPVNRQVNGHFQRNQPIDWYIQPLSKAFSSVEKVGKFLVCKV